MTSLGDESTNQIQAYVPSYGKIRFTLVTHVGQFPGQDTRILAVKNYAIEWRWSYDGEVVNNYN